MEITIDIDTLYQDLQDHFGTGAATFSHVFYAAVADLETAYQTQNWGHIIDIAQQEHFNLGIGLFLGAKEACREYLCVVEDKGVALVEVVQQVAEGHVLLRIVALGILLEDVDFLALAVNHHELALVAVIDTVNCSVLVFKGAVGRVESYQLLRESEFELR